MRTVFQQQEIVRQCKQGGIQSGQQRALEKLETGKGRLQQISSLN